MVRLEEVPASPPAVAVLLEVVEDTPRLDDIARVMWTESTSQSTAEDRAAGILYRLMRESQRRLCREYISRWCAAGQEDVNECTKPNAEVDRPKEYTYEKGGKQSLRRHFQR